MCHLPLTLLALHSVDSRLRACYPPICRSFSLLVAIIQVVMDISAFLFSNRAACFSAFSLISLSYWPRDSAVVASIDRTKRGNISVVRWLFLKAPVAGLKLSYRARPSPGLSAEDLALPAASTSLLFFALDFASAPFPSILPSLECGCATAEKMDSPERSLPEAERPHMYRVWCKILIKKACRIAMGTTRTGDLRRRAKAGHPDVLVRVDKLLEAWMDNLSAALTETFTESWSQAQYEEVYHQLFELVKETWLKMYKDRKTRPSRACCPIPHSPRWLGLGAYRGNFLGWEVNGDRAPSHLSERAVRPVHRGANGGFETPLISVIETDRSKQEKSGFSRWASQVGSLAYHESKCIAYACSTCHGLLLRVSLQVRVRQLQSEASSEGDNSTPASLLMALVRVLVFPFCSDNLALTIDASSGHSAGDEGRPPRSRASSRP